MVILINNPILVTVLINRFQYYYKYEFNRINMYDGLHGGTVGQ